MNTATRISRRSFHKLALAGVGLPAVGPLLPSRREAEETVDVLVVGGGVSGAYAAWRLLTGELASHSPLRQVRQGVSRPRVALLEGSDRIGGRLYTVSQPDSPHLHAELGGMRFLATHESVIGLARHLGLTIADFPMGGTGNRQFFRHTSFGLGDYEAHPDRVPYHLLDGERGQLPWHVVSAAFLSVFPALAGMSTDQAREYLKTVDFEGRPLWEVGFWNFLARELSVDAYSLVIDTSGYHTVCSNWNAYDAIVFILEDFASPTYHKLAEGYQSLPLTLVRQFVEQGGALHLETTATSLSRGPSNLRVATVGPDGKERVFGARHVVLALPRRSLELLDPDSFIFTQQFRDDLARVTPEPAGKIFLWYDQDWWSALGLSSGPSITDLPLRQCYYFGTETADPGARGAGLLMASYHDGPAVDFWSGYFSFSAQTLPPPPLANRGGFLQALAPSQIMIDELTRQLSALHQVEVPRPHTALYRNWTADPYGAAWHFWNPHNRSWEVIPRVRRPVPDANVYVCGEAFSSNQGWVVGAINTAERVLDTYLGMKRPGWVGPSHSFGP